MPPLASVSIPVLSSHIKAPLHPPYKPRLYPSTPLPVGPSQHAPRECRITQRTQDSKTQLIAYTLKIGDLDFGEVGPDEILDFVSPLHLENFEHGLFEEAQEAVLVAAEAEAEEKVKGEVGVGEVKRKQKAKTKGTVVYEELDDEGGGANGGVRQERLEAAERAGRARPTYKHLYKVPLQRRRRRKRDPRTGELMPLSDEEGESELVGREDSDEEMEDARLNASTLVPMEVPKRRRRKRDTETGELLPLSPRLADDRTMAEASRPTSPEPMDFYEKPKRPRRRRHPVTNELMPLGWKYDPDEENAGKGSAGPSTRVNVSTMQGLSLDDRQIKRRKVDGTPSSANRFRSPVVALPSSQQQKTSSREVIELISTSSESNDHDQQTGNRASGPLRRSVGGMLGSKTNAMRGGSASETSPELEQPSQQSRRGTMTSIMHPISQQVDDPSDSEDEITAANPLQAFKNASTTKNDLLPNPSSQHSQPGQRTSISRPIGSAPLTTGPDMDPSDSDAEDPIDDQGSEDLEEGEFHVEAILAHHLSDPATHPKELGRKPVMLYQVKWEGWKAPTWEPESSFGDPEVVAEYERRLGLGGGKGKERLGMGADEWVG